MTFPGLDISLLDVALFQNNFRNRFRVSMAENANVDFQDVEILSIYSGSVQVASRVSFSSNDPTADTQAASYFTAVLMVDAKGIFSHPDFEAYGAIIATNVEVGPSNITWNESVLSSFPSVSQHPEATEVEFVFGAPEVPSFTCQLDDEDVECVSPYATPHLQPGQHVFRVTPAASQSGQGQQTKQVVWEVIPRFELGTRRLDMEVTIPQTVQSTVAVTRVDVEGILSCSVDQSRSSPGLEPSCLVSYIRASPPGSTTATLAVQVGTVNGVQGNEEGGMYNATMVVTDIGAESGIISSVDFIVNVLVNKQSTLLMFPPNTVQASGEGLVGQVFVGETALPERIQLLSLSNTPTEFQITMNTKESDGIAEGQSQASVGDILALSQSNGMLNYSGNLMNIDITFFAAPTQFTGLISQELLVSNSYDGSQQKLLVSMMVIPGEISNRSSVAFDTNVLQSGDGHSSSAAVTVGDSVDIVIHPEDRYGNPLGAGNLFTIQMYPLVATVSGNSTVNALGSVPVLITIEGPTFRPELGLYQASVSGISRFGQYQIFVALIGSNINLDRSPLSLQATKVACSVAMHRVASEAGDQCECMVGYVPDLIAVSDDDELVCMACELGSYSSTQTDDQCTSCLGTMTTLQVASTSPSQCVCSPGYFFVGTGDTQSCQACPAGTYSSLANSSKCELCPQGSTSPSQASEVAQCAPCDENFITEHPGATECLLCSDPNAETRMEDRTKCFCKQRYYADFETYDLGYNRTCKPCPNGGECLLDMIYGTKDFWRKDLSKEMFYKCKPSFCLEESDNSSTPCREGHEGVLCGSCSEGYSIQGRFCEPCSDSIPVTTSVPVAMFFGSLFLMAWMSSPIWFDLSKQLDQVLQFLKGEANNAESLAGVRSDDDMEEHMQMATFCWEQVKTVMKIIISFYQVMCSFLDVYEIPWPPAVHDAFVRLQVFQFDFFTFPVLGCVYPNPDYFLSFHIYMVFPIALSAFMYGVLWGMLKFRIDPTDHALRSRMSSHVLATWLFILFLIYPALSAKVLRVFNCMDIYGTDYLVADLREECYTGDHAYEIFLALVGVLMYPIGIPLVFLYLLMHSRVHDVAKYKEAQLMFTKCAYKVAAIRQHPELCSFIRDNPVDTLFERVPNHLLKFIVDELVPLPEPEEGVSRWPSYLSTKVRSRHGSKNRLVWNSNPEAVSTSHDAITSSASEIGGPAPQTSASANGDAEVVEAPSSEEAATVDFVERGNLISQLLDWAKDHPDGQELCALPKLHWIRRTHKEAPDLTYFQRKEFYALHRFGSIFMSFQTRCWWYEILDLSRKLVLNGLIIFVGQGSSGQVALGCFFCILMMVLHVHMNPYEDSVQNRLSLLCLAQLACILFVGLLFKVDTVDDGSVSSDILSFLIVFLSAFLVIVPIIDAAFTFGLIGWNSDGTKRKKMYTRWSSNHIHCTSTSLQLQPNHAIHIRDVEVYIDEEASSNTSPTMDAPAAKQTVQEDSTFNANDSMATVVTDSPMGVHPVLADDNMDIEL